MQLNKHLFYQNLSRFEVVTKWKRRKRRRYTLKEKPLLNLFLLHAPWRRQRYSVRREEDRVVSLVKAIGLHYGLKHEHDYVRPVRLKRYHRSRALYIHRRFESRLTILLQRVGWFSCPSSVSNFIATSPVYHRSLAVGYAEGYDKFITCRATPNTRVTAGDELILSNDMSEHIQLWFNGMVRWKKNPKGLNDIRVRPRWVPKSKGRMRVRIASALFRLYKQYKGRSIARKYSRLSRVCTEGFYTNYNTLIARYRPSNFRVQYIYRHNKIQGPGLDFWSDTLSLKKF